MKLGVGSVGYFVYKLIPPRRLFAQDITEAEAELLKVHGKYWRRLADREIAVLFGSLGPKEGWGLAMVETKDEAEANARGVNDPAIKTNTRFRFEVHPMPQTALEMSNGSIELTSSMDPA